MIICSFAKLASLLVLSFFLSGIDRIAWANEWCEEVYPQLAPPKTSLEEGEQWDLAIGPERESDIRSAESEPVGPHGERVLERNEDDEPIHSFVVDDRSTQTGADVVDQKLHHLSNKWQLPMTRKSRLGGR